MQLDSETGRLVAIKSIAKAAYREGVNLGAIKELQAMQELSHKNVLAVSHVRSLPLKPGTNLLR